MATNTTNYNFKKPDESDFYSIQDQNGNWDKADAALKDVDTPTFEDYSGSMTVPDAATAINSIRSKGKLSTILSNMKAAFKGACLIGQIVNNCVTNNAKLPLSAAQGKALMDLYTQLNSDLAASSVKCVDGAGMAGSALYADKFGKIICIRGYVKPTNGYSFDAWNRQIVAWLPNNNYLPRGQVTGLTIYSDSRLKIEINVDNSVVLQNLSGSAITANGESGIDIMITYCCQ